MLEHLADVSPPGQQGVRAENALWKPPPVDLDQDIEHMDAEKGQQEESNQLVDSERPVVATEKGGQE